MKLKLYELVPNHHGNTYAVEISEDGFTLHREFKSIQEAASACPRLVFEVQLNLKEKERAENA